LLDASQHLLKLVLRAVREIRGKSLTHGRRNYTASLRTACLSGRPDNCGQLRTVHIFPFTEPKETLT
jgi:hypothetical protein